MAETEKSQTPKPGIELGTPANAAHALRLSHRDKRHHQPVWLTILSTLPPLHNRGIIQCPQTNPFCSGDPSRSPGIVHHARPRTFHEFACRNCVSRYVGRTAQRLSSRIRQHVPLHLLPEDSDARADRPTRGRHRKIPETEDLVPEATIIAEEIARCLNFGGK